VYVSVVIGGVCLVRGTKGAVNLCVTSVGVDVVNAEFVAEA
jgi:hypothetical protein